MANNITIDEAETFVISVAKTFVEGNMGTILYDTNPLQNIGLFLVRPREKNC